MSRRQEIHTLLDPAQDAIFTDPGGHPHAMPIYRRTSNGKEYVQCPKCEQFYLLNAARAPTYYSNHYQSDNCKKATAALEARRLRESVEAEAERAKAMFSYSSGSASFTRARSIASISTFSSLTPIPSLPTTPTVSNPRPLPFMTDSTVPDSRLLDDADVLALARNFSDLPRSSPPPGHSSEYDGAAVDLGDDDDPPELEDTDDELEIEPATAEGSTESCLGQRVQWLPGSVWDTFPYQQHADDTIGWRPFLIEDSDWIRLKSTRCRKILSTAQEKDQKTCESCLKIVNSASYQKCVKRADGAASAHIPYKYLNASQTRRVLAHMRKRGNSMKLNLLNLNRKIGNLQRKVNDHQRIVMLLSQKKIAGVTRLLNASLRNGASASAIYDRLQLALTQAYKPKGNWSRREYDVAFLIKALGGPRLLFVLQKEEGYPSATTVRRRKPISEIMVSTGIPSVPEFNANITSFLGSDTGRQPPPDPRVGQILMIDGVALEEMCRFDLKRNCVLGLCREHTGNAKITVDEIEDLNRLTTAVFTEKTIHHGKDGTVVGIAPITGEQNYFTVPLVLSGSCKKETGLDLAKWVPRIIEAYRANPDGENRHGPIHTVATDGESSFRKLRFQIGLSQDLDAASPLGKIIYQLPGMNIRTGANGLLTTSDPKHIIKRFATMIRSPSGIQIADVHLSTDVTRSFLLRLPEMSAQKVQQLLHPADKQNVPKAVNLLQSLLDLESVESRSLNPALHLRLNRIVFLSKTLGYFLSPFVDVKMSLSEQLRSLSTYSHLITAMYLQHRTAFLTSALFADSQSIVKNIFFTTARLQVADNSLKYFILFEGTDRLENVFSNVRTQDHSRNFDILQLAQKLSIAAEVNAIFERYPDLNRGHVRRNLVNVRGVDHVNPASWIGRCVVGEVDIVKEYLSGRDAANHLLVRYFGATGAVDFDTIFNGNSNIDHLRPLGRYIGSKIETDNLDDVDINEDDNDDEGTISEVLQGTDPADPPAIDLRDTADPVQESMLAAGAEDQLQTEPEKAADRLMVNGRPEYKPTLVARMLSSEAGKKVTTRPLRARGIAVSEALQSRLENLNNTAESTNSDNCIKSGDLGAFFVRMETELCLAVGEIMSFQKGTSKEPLAAIDFDQLDATGSDAISISVQVLDLAPRGTLPNRTWIWETQKFLRVLGKKDGPTTLVNYTLRIAGPNLFPLGPSVVDHSDSSSLTWSVDDTQLREILDTAWSEINVDTDQAQMSANVLRLPMILQDRGLPYQLPDSTTQFCRSFEALSLLPTTGKKDADQQVPCRICERVLPLKDMRNHVGQHILLASRDCEDKSAKVEVGINPCGWCGMDGTCRTQLVESGTSTSITSDCEYHYARMIYARAAVPSKRTPCSNVPLNCPLCSPVGEVRTFWKYNLLVHMATHHTRNDGTLPSFPRQLLVSAHIQKAEELAMGIGEKQTSDWRDETGWLHSDAIEALHSDEEYQLTRKRAGSSVSEASTRSRQPSPTKRSHLI